MSSNLYIAATRPGEGKTAITLGIMAALKARTPNIGFIKPVGHRDIERRDLAIDEDTLLVARVCNLHADLQDTSPVTLDPGFPDRFLTEEERQQAIGAIIGSFSRVSDGRDFVVIEGSGHAAVGHNLGLSNGFLASLMGAKMLLVTSGALQHPVDELALNKQFLEQWGVPLIGVILNRVHPADEELIEKYTRPVLDDLGIELLGVVPNQPELGRPTMLEIRGELEAEVFSGRPNLGWRPRRTLVGAMTAENAFHRLEKAKPGNLLITAGDRTDLILAALICDQRRRRDQPAGIFSGLVLTGGIPPHEGIRPLLRESNLPVLLAEKDSYAVARQISEMVVRIDPSDRLKVQRIIDLVDDRVDIERLLERLDS